MIKTAGIRTMANINWKVVLAIFYRENIFWKRKIRDNNIKLIIKIIPKRCLKKRNLWHFQAQVQQ